MTTRLTTSVIDDRVEPLLEEFLAEVVTGLLPVSRGPVSRGPDARGPDARGNGEQSITAALTEAAMVSFSRTVIQASPVERALLAEALSPALAGALAPALAKELAPEIVTALSQLATAVEASGDEPAADDREPETSLGDAGLEGR